ncbi:hypothetical protein [Herminiimonas sp. CN]|nr:hypothetical protein [Herminiimonas sp. CN]
MLTRAGNTATQQDYRLRQRHDLAAHLHMLPDAMLARESFADS